MKKSSHKNIVAIIPARGGSKGIPGKNIMDFCGKPLLVWSIDQALKSKYIQEVYVSSDSPRILDVAESAGAKAIRRPAVLATDRSSSEEALLHALEYIEKTQGQSVDIAVFLQATSPVRETSDIDNALRTFISRKADSLFSAALLDDFCIWEKKGRKLRSITYDYKNRLRRQDRKPYFLENGSIFIFKPEILRRNQNRMGGKIFFYIMPLWKSHQIDNCQDIEICKYYMQNKILSRELKLKKIGKIKLIVYDFDGVLTDNKVVLNEDGIEHVVVNRSDGLAIGMLKKRKLKQLILTTEKNRVVALRAKKLGIPLISGVEDKKSALLSYCKNNGVALDKVVYLGNDINDLEAMKLVRYPACPSDASLEIRRISKIILDKRGGEGAVRALIRYL